jgi:phage shock protein A
MSIFDRIGLLLRSNVNSMIDKAEDPQKILDQLLIDMRDQFIQAKQQVAVAIADEKRLAAKVQSTQAAVTDLEGKAMRAVQAGDDALASQFLHRQQIEQQNLAGFQQQWEQQKQVCDQLRQALLQLNDKIDEAKRKKDLLIARAKRAEAQKTIQNTMAGLNDNSAFDTFGRMADKVEQMEAEASASAALAEEVQGTDLDAKLRKLEADQGGNAALAALKAKMGLAPPAAPKPALTSSATVDEFQVPDIGVVETKK